MARVTSLLAAGCLTTASLAAQSRSARLLQTARDHIAANQLDSADAALHAALESAPYVMDSVNVLVWRGILEHLRSNDSLARLSFRQALTLSPGFKVPGLEHVYPELAQIFDEELRRIQVYTASAVDQPPVRVAAPPVAYPAALRRRGVAGRALVAAIVDTLGRVEPRSLEVLETPDSGLIEPLRQMMLGSTFTPGRLRGHSVRTRIWLGVDLKPGPPPSATQLVTAAREQLAARRTDSALALVREALDTAVHATDGERVYALFVRGLAWRATGRDSLAAAAFDTALAGYSDLTARGADLAPLLRRLADSVRLGRRAAARASAASFAAPTVVGPVDEQPALVSYPPIRYPPEMQTLRIGGTVIVEAALDTAGRVVPETVKIVQSPNPVFDAEARRVVIAARYRPARAGGRPVRAVIRQPITFAPY